MGILNKIFGTEKQREPADLSVLKTDMHSHLIPAIDDGSDSIEDSVNMIRRFSDLGYEKLITTPHVMSDHYKNNPSTILPGLEKVQKALEEQNINIELQAAAEYYLDEFFHQKVKEKDVLTFGDNYLLFELSFYSEPVNLNEIIFEMQTAGYKPILAHPERYSYWHKDMEKYEDMVSRGVMLQLNMLSLIGHYSPAVKKVSDKLIDNEMVDFLGSDCHHIFHTELMEEARKTPSLHKLLDGGRLKNRLL